jgi:phospholipid/cholesterol/gamma-HCH transport system substrate-binding protein
MRSRWNLPIYGVYLVICVTVIGYIVAQMGITAPGAKPYTLTVTFHDAAGILPNNEVFMNGTKVGHVDSVSAAEGNARVAVVVDDARALPIHPDAVAEVRKKNLLGETYVDLQRGSAPGTLPSGGSIPIEHTITSTQIDEVLAVLDPQTVQRVQLLINAAGGGLANNGDAMNAEAGSLDTTLNSLNGPAAELSARQQQVQDIVLELQRFYTVLAKQREQVRQEFSTWNDVMAQMAAQEQAIAGTVQQADQLLTSIDTLVSGQGANIRAAISELPGALQQANAFLDQSNPILSGIAPFRQSVHDVFPHLASSFADTDPSGQHFWSVYSVNCGSGCGADQPQTASYGSTGSAPFWASAGGGENG